MGAPVQAHSTGGRNKCARPHARAAMGAGSWRSLASIHRLGGAAAALGLCLPAVAAAPAWGLGSSSSGGGPPRSSGRLAFGYALPASRSFGPPSFYPPGAPAPAEELHFEEAVAAARQSRARRIERFPAFPETPAALAHEISGACVCVGMGRTGGRGKRGWHRFRWVD